MTWLYANQGEMRFGAENRLFVILVDANDISQSWKMKRAFTLIEPKVNSYLDNFSEGTLKKIDFKTSTFTYLEISNSKIENCSFLNLNLGEQSIYKTSFKDCSFLGTNFSNSFFKEVEFIDCNFEYSNFSNACLDKVLFKNCNLKDASFYKMQQKRLQFLNCNLEAVDVFETNLEKIDIRTCNINHIKIDIPSMKGLVVNEAQALALAKFLQIKIE